MNSTGDAQDLALKRYGQVLGTMQYESNVFWTRSQLFLAAHALLLGFAFNGILEILKKEPLWMHLLVVGAICIAGIALSVLWKQAHQAGLYWIDHWRDVLLKLEDVAYGPDLPVHRKFPEKPGYISATGVAKKTSTLFLWVWILATLFVALLEFMKCAGAGPL